MACGVTPALFALPPPSGVVALASPAVPFAVGPQVLLSAIRLTVFTLPVHPKGIPMAGKSLGNLLLR
jgi:hypothetical protein